MTAPPLAPLPAGEWTEETRQRLEPLRTSLCLAIDDLASVPNIFTTLVVGLP